MPRSIDPNDIVGRCFGRLRVVAFHSLTRYRFNSRWRRDYRYLCRCSCRRTKVATRVNLLTGHTKTCGCRTKPKGAANPRWTGRGKISGVHWARIRNHARIRRLRFEITIDDAWATFERQRGRCALIGLRLRLNGHRTASLDRIRNGSGYVPGNIPCLSG